MLKFIDISNYQKGLDVAAVAASGGLGAIVCKATEGTSFVDAYATGFVQQARDAGLGFGFYHFGRSGDAATEAEYFYSKTAGWAGEGIPVLDWEDGQTVDWVNRWVERYHDLSGVWPVIYANPWRFRQGEVCADCGRWVAGYPASGITAIDYGITTDLPAGYTVDGIICAWQFSSSVRLDGYDGNLDGDVFYGDRTAWDAYATGGGSATVSATVSADPVEEVAVDGFWGSATTRRLQETFGTPADGEVWHQVKATVKANPALSIGWLCDSTGEGSPLVRAMQSALGVDVDGLIGPVTISALQTHEGTTVDGSLWAASPCVMEMQRRLNAGGW